MPQNALFGLVVVTRWRRHNSRQSRNRHLVSTRTLIAFIKPLYHIQAIALRCFYLAANFQRNIIQLSKEH